MTIGAALSQGERLLADRAVPVPRLTAEVLLSHAVRCERPYLYAHPEQEVDEVQWLHYGRYLHERLKGKPTQYITCRQEFYGREFKVTPDVLIPRPETEHVIEVALSIRPAPKRVVDVGCGSGAIGVTLKLEMSAAVFATDISVAALAVAAQNSRLLEAPVNLIVCDLVSALRDHSIEMIVSNPPYVAERDEPGLQKEVRDFEPRVALFAGPTGFEIYERLIQDAPRVLRPGGWIVLELGFQTRGRVEDIFGGRWQNVRVEPDLAGIPRVLAAQCK